MSVSTEQSDQQLIYFQEMYNKIEEKKKKERKKKGKLLSQISGLVSVQKREHNFTC